ncbi:hypothetical protein PsorP6_002244 [Peronosclerospora sorghi]|uniref:Uncharacterized protein n=1 Tax=Peronosclerospora sorghi TaxID=230839 RepID=A0ACC0WV93_9STRA|nr:hypothetical protein PsorP6_002244 [Peronosclerospora sorghi]
MTMCRRYATLYKTSPAFHKKLKEACKYRNISGGISILQDVATRWWSTRTMLKRMVNLNPALVILRLNDISIKLVLKVFARAETFMEADERVTISLVPTALRSILHSIGDAIANLTTTTTAATSE